MSSWLSAFVPALAAIAITLGPGLALLWMVRLRGLALVAAAPVASVAMIGLSALGLGALDIRWSALSFLGAVCGILAVGFLVRLLCTASPRGRITAGGTPRVLMAIALLIGGAITAWRLASYIADPEAISQTNDAVFHLNAVRFIAESGSASSLDVNGFMGGSSFYPAAWHALVSLIAEVTGVDVPLAVNATTLVISGVVWTLGIAWLARVVFKSNMVGAVAAVLSGAFQAFPMLMFQWGVLYPNALSISLIPASLAIVFCLRGWVTAGSLGWRPGWRGYLVAFLLVMVSLTALALSQPAALIPWALISAISVTATVWRMKTRTIVTRLGWISFMWIVVGSIWWQLSRSTSGSHWPPFRGKLAAFADIVFNGHMLIPFAFGLSFFMLVGLAVCAHQPGLRWVLASWLALSALYVLVASVGNPFVRDGVLGAWYADPYRLAALTPVIVVPVTAFGFVCATRWLGHLFTQARVNRQMGVLAVGAASVIMIGLVIVRPVAMPDAMNHTVESSPAYAMTDDSYLSLDERELLELLINDVESDARILANPSTGSGFGYMLTGLDVYPPTWNPPQTDEWQIIANSLRDATTDPEVCAALENYGDPTYVLDFGSGEQGAGRYEAWGMTGFEGQPGFELVRIVGDASLWRIGACNS